LKEGRFSPWWDCFGRESLSRAQPRGKMGGWFETAGVVLIIVFGAVVGRLFSRLKNPHWGWGYFIPLLLIAFLIVANHVGLRISLPILAWASAGRARFVIIGLSVAMGSVTLIGRLKSSAEKVIVFVLMFGIVLWSSVLPFLAPTLIKGELVNLQTKINADNVCVQGTDYTCGPAAAVSALRQLGLPAQEGEIAILSHTSPVAGTLPWCLYKAIQNRYAQQGVDCQLRRFNSVGQLREADVTLAIVNDTFLLDHCVAVLEVDDETITIADPAVGRQKISHKAFESVWRFYGIALKQNNI
jgi:hypothetical protein